MTFPVQLVQLALAAGKAVWGSRLLPAIVQNKARLVVCSEGCGANTRKKIQDKCAYRHIPVCFVPAEQFDLISQHPAVAYAIVDNGFADGILKKIGKER